MSVCGQVQTISESINFSTNNQNMWGSGNGFSLDLDQEIFRLNPTINFDSGNDGIVNLGGYDFGVGMAVDFWMDIGSNFKIQGLTTGTVGVDYPLQVNFDIPSAGSFDKGDTIVISTSYLADPGSVMNTQYPTGGRTSLDMHIGFGIDASLTFCAFGCATIPIIPNLQLPVQTFDIFALETNPDIVATYPCAPCALPVGPCIPIPQICVDTITPIEFPENPFGIGGGFSLPYVVTTSSTEPSTNCLVANGTDDYIEVNLEIFKFIGFFAGLIPPPVGPAIENVLGNLSNSFSLPFGASLEYVLFTASFRIINTNNQEFRFCPTIASQFNLAIPVNYFVTDAAQTITGSGYGTNIPFNLGDKVHIQFPCNYEFMDLTPQYSVQDAPNFSNHTFDIISFRFDMEALSFSFIMPDIPITPEICFPEICLDFIFDEVCFPAWCIPALTFPGFSVSYGPVWADSISLGQLPEITYFDETWSLQGFTPVNGTTFQLTPRDFSASMTATDVPCMGESTGSATVTLTNGAPPFTYAWDNLQVQQLQSNTATLSGLNAGPHFVLVTNRGGCTALGEITINEPSSYLLIPEVFTTDVSCNAGNDGQIGLNVQGGTGPYTFSWNPGVSSSDTAINVTAGTYLVTVSDANGCDTSSTVTIHEPYPLLLSALTQPLVCTGVNNASIDLTISGGSPPYVVQWNTGQITEDLNGLSAGNYQVTVTDAKNCPVSLMVSIAQAPPAISIANNTVSDVSCKYGSDGLIALQVNGGNVPYYFEWYNSAGIMMATHSDTLQNISAGAYTVKIVDSAGCYIQEQYNVYEPAFELSYTETHNYVSCHGGNNGSIQLITSGGTPSYTYIWSGGQSGQSANNLSAGLHVFIITDAKGCTLRDSLYISEPPQELSVSFSITPVSCHGDSSGSISVTGGGGTPPYNYQWSTGISTANLTGLTAAYYHLSVVDSHNCVLPDTFQVTEPPAIILSATTDSVHCFGEHNGAIDLTVSGGVFPYTYQWSDSDSIILANSGQNLFNSGAGTYTVLVKDSNNCSVHSDFVIAQPVSPLSISLTGSNINCFGASSGTITSLVSGGTTPYTYSWNNGASNAFQSNLPAGNYSLIVSDANQCVDSSIIVLSEPPDALQALVNPLHVKCNGGMDGAAQLLISGGVMPYHILWNTGDTLSLLSGLSSGIYTAVITDANLCTSTTGTVINEPSQPLAINYITDSVTCFGGVDGKMKIDISGGTMPYVITWGQSIVLMNNISNHDSVAGLSAGSYIVRVTDYNNCVETGNLEIVQPAELSFFAVPHAASCFGSGDGKVLITLSGWTPPYQYLWSDSSILHDAFNLKAGYYSVRITDAHNCVFQSNYVQVTQPDSLTLQVAVTDASCHGAKDAVVQIEANGGIGEFIYHWSDGSEGATLNNLHADTLFVVSTDENGCYRNDTIIVGEKDENCFRIVNTFTPNGDGKNDTWQIGHTELYPEMEVSIFNKWGNIIFTSIGYTTPWDGTFNGRPLPSATYYYIINLHNGEAPLNGPVTILR